MTQDEKCSNARKSFYAMLDYIEGLNKDIQLGGYGRIGCELDINACDGQLVYRVTMNTSQKLDEWMDSFDGDITRDRLEEHLLYTDIIKNYKPDERRRKKLRTPELIT